MPTELICRCGHTKAEHEKGKNPYCSLPLCCCLKFELAVPTLHVAQGKEPKR